MKPTRRLCQDCGAHSFDRRCRVCGSDHLEDLGPRFESAKRPKESDVAVAATVDDLNGDASSPDR